MLISLFLVYLLHFLFVPCGRLIGYPSAFHCTLNTQYRIVQYRKYQLPITALTIQVL